MDNAKRSVEESKQSVEGLEQSIKELLRPTIEQSGLHLYDTELNSGILRVTIDREGGVDVDAIGNVAQRISRLLDEADLVADEHYILEVSSPGIERKLRLPEHYRAAINTLVRVRLVRAIQTAQGDLRRFDGRLESATDNGIEIEINGSPVSFDYADIADARTVFDWDADIAPAADTHEDDSVPTQERSPKNNARSYEQATGQATERVSTL